MDLMEKFLISLGAAVVVYYGVKVLLSSRMLFPKVFFPLPKGFFTSMGEWAVVTGASEGIGRAYALELAQQGMNVVIMSRTKAALDQVAKKISETTGQKVKVIVTDFMKENVFSELEDQLKDLNIGVLVNNVGMLPNLIPCKFLESTDLDQMCKIILPGMEKRRRGVIVNISSGVASVPFPLYTLYAATKVFVERFSHALQAEYKNKGITIQIVAPFGVSTRMAGYLKADLVTLTPEDFVRSSLQYVTAGDKTYGSICHMVLGWILRSIPPEVLYSESMMHSLKDYVNKKLTQSASISAHGGAAHVAKCQH